MKTFVDTSALIALVDVDERTHGRAKAVYEDRDLARGMVTHNYVVVEAVAVAQRRLGPAAVRDLIDRILPALDVIWVDRSVHDASVFALLASSRRRLSLVDLVSFEVMRKNEIDTAFAFDRDYREHGFKTIP